MFQNTIQRSWPSGLAKAATAHRPPTFPDNGLGDVLVIDDDALLRKQIADFLSERNCRARTAGGSNDQIGLVRSGLWGLIVLDIQPSQGGGLDRLRAIRQMSDVPVLVTGRRLPAADRVVALELGADGYIDKPFDLHEFWAQARAIGRRHQLGRHDSSARRQRGGYRFSGWTLNLSDRSLVDPAGSVVRLSRTIYALLLAFLDAPGRPLPRAYLLQATRAREDIFDRSIDVQVLRLRRALERGEGCQRLIRTELGVGYIFDGPVERLHRASAPLVAFAASEEPSRKHPAWRTSPDTTNSDSLR